MKQGLLLVAIALLLSGCVLEGAASSTLTLTATDGQNPVELGYRDVVWRQDGQQYGVVGRGQYADEHRLVMSMDDPASRVVEERYLRIYAGGDATEWADYHIELLLPSDPHGLAPSSVETHTMLLYRGRISAPQKVSMDQLRFRAAHLSLTCDQPGAPSLVANGEILARPPKTDEYESLEMGFNRNR